MNIITDETNLIKTLARESEKINTKETFFLPKLNHQSRDFDVTGWNENKSVVSSFFHISVLKNRLRPSQHINELWKTKLNQSPESLLKHQKSISLPFTRTTVYKISNLSLNEAIKQELLSQSVNRKPKLPFLHKNALISVYLPPKRNLKKAPKKNSQLAEVNDLLQMLRPEINSPITRKIVSNLRSKISLKKFSSKRQLSKINLNNSFLTSQASEVKS